MNKKDLHAWCLEQAALRYMEELPQEQIDNLNSQNFPWEYYENELDKLGFNWERNKNKKS